MAPICNVVGGVALNGVAVVAGSAPDTDIPVPAFYYGGFLTPTVATATGYCFFILSYQTLNQELLLSGCCSGLAGSLYFVYAYQAYDDYTSSIYYENALYIKNDQPFSFKIPVDPFKIAILITGKTK
jgi:hypothetical protein